jgi:hypothetical protein
METLKQLNTKKAALITIVMISLLSLGILLPIHKGVAFEYENSGRLLAFFPAEDGSEFKIKFIHSIHLTPVYESYRIEGSKIVQHQIKYKEFGIGMPANAEGEESFSEIDGYYVISGMNREFQQIDLRVARVTESQELMVNGKNIAFTTFASQGSWLRIKVKYINSWRLLKGGNILDR